MREESATQWLPDLPFSGSSNTESFYCLIVSTVDASAGAVQPPLAAALELLRGDHAVVIAINHFETDLPRQAGEDTGMVPLALCLIEPRMLSTRFVAARWLLGSSA
jgi:hypothetical protein